MFNVYLHTVLRSVADTLTAYVKCFKIFVAPKHCKPQSGDKHLLLLTWAFPPDVTGGVYRPISIVRGAKKRGWRVTIICGHPSEIATSAGIYLKKYISDADKIIRLQRSTLKPSYKLFFPKINGGFLNMLETIELACKVLANDQPSIILASGPPFHNFVVARELSKRFGKPYVLDYRDEWTECPFDFVKTENLDRYFEKKCIQDARKIIFTTESHFRHQKRCFEILDETKVSVIPNGWEIEDAPNEGTINPLPAAGFRLAFLGHLSEHTLPRKFLKTLETCLEEFPELISKLRIAFVGSKSASAVKQLHEFKFQDLIEILDNVPKPVALKIMQDAAGLIIINEPRLDRYRPGKLYDYLAMRTPILVYGGGGEVENVVTQLKAGAVVYTNNHEELHGALLKLNSIKDNFGSVEVDAWLAKHTRTALAETMVDLLETVGTEKQVP